MAQEFQPNTIEITKRLDLSKADEKTMSQMRKNVFADEDSLLRGVLGAGLEAKLPSLRIFWGRFGEFVQSIEIDALVASNEGTRRTDEFTRQYRIDS